MSGGVRMLVEVYLRSKQLSIDYLPNMLQNYFIGHHSA
jgi:hypothetical protein